MIIRAGWVPVLISFVNFSRSTSDSPTVNTFGRGIAQPSFQQGEELLRKPLQQISIDLAATRY
jgi:hypothetical protein